MLRGFATINYWAGDLDAAKRWYAGLLSVEPYFERAGPDGRPAYAEFRVGDYQDELGLVDRRRAPSGTATEPGGRSCAGTSRTSRRCLRSCCRWVHASTSRLRRAATRVRDGCRGRPFGNVLGVMYNPHYLKTLKPSGGVTRREFIAFSDVAAGGVAGRAPCDRAGRMAEDRQEGFGPAAGDDGGGGRGRVVLRLDRQPAKVSGRAVVPAESIRRGGLGARGRGSTLSVPGH